MMARYFQFGEVNKRFINSFGVMPFAKLTNEVVCSRLTGFTAPLKLHLGTKIVSTQVCNEFFPRHPRTLIGVIGVPLAKRLNPATNLVGKFQHVIQLHA